MRQTYRQGRAKRLKRYANAVTRLKFKIADKPDAPEVEAWREKLRYFEKVLAYMEDSPYLLAHDPYIAEKLSVKITRLEYLSAFYRKANKLYRKQGNFEGMILTRYWRETLTANALEIGIPVPEKWFWRLRTLLKHYRRRLEAAAKLK